MYAKLENSKIKVYNKLPSKFKGITGNYAGGFYALDPATILAEGFKPLVKPPISDVFLYGYGEIIEYSDRFEYEIVLISPDQTLAGAKEKRMTELRSIATDLFNETNWYYERETRTDKMANTVRKSVPDWVLIRDKGVYESFDIIEGEINALTTISEVLSYTITLA